MASPKSNPKMQKRMPTSRRLWPVTPKKLTVERSGTCRLASPPASLGCANARVDPNRMSAVTMPNIFAGRDKECVTNDSRLRLASQVCIKSPPMYCSVFTRCRSMKFANGSAVSRGHRTDAAQDPRPTGLTSQLAFRVGDSNRRHRQPLADLLFFPETRFHFKTEVLRLGRVGSDCICPNRHTLA